MGATQQYNNNAENLKLRKNEKEQQKRLLKNGTTLVGKCRKTKETTFR